MKHLKVHEGGRFLATEDGKPFFWQADTAWELFHRLTKPETTLYFQKRREQGFNVVQAVALAEIDGIRIPNREGAFALKRNPQACYDPDLPDLDREGNYWDHVDFTFDEAEKHGIYIAFLPTWGDKYNASHWGKGPEIFTPENAERYGFWLGTRYGKRPNLVWVLGGDRPLHTWKHFEVIRAMARGIKASGSRNLTTFHPPGGTSSSLPFPDEPWLDFHMIQSGHGTDPACHHEMIEKDYNSPRVKPVVEGETNYEDHPIGFNSANGYFDQVDVRRASYHALMAGSLGITYGHHCVWPMRTLNDNREDPWSDNYFLMDWLVALDRPGAWQVRHMKRLFESKDFFSRVPDQELLVKNFGGMNHLQACRGKDYLMVYIPNGISFSIRMGRIPGNRVRALWFDPRTGEREVLGEFENSGEVEFRPPRQGRDHDYIFIQESIT